MGLPAQTFGAKLEPLDVEPCNRTATSLGEALRRMVEQPQNDPLDDAIAAMRAAFVEALARGDAAAAAAVYTETARLLPPAAEPMEGRPAIEAFWRAGIESGVAEVELEARELEQRDGLAYEIGRYALRLRAADGSTIVDRGKYVLVHQRQADGTWRRAVEMFSPDAAAAAEARP